MTFADARAVTRSYVRRALRAAQGRGCGPRLSTGRSGAAASRANVRRRPAPRRGRAGRCRPPRSRRSASRRRPAQPASAARRVLRRWAKAASTTAKIGAPVAGRRLAAGEGDQRAVDVRRRPEDGAADRAGPADVGVPGGLHRRHAVGPAAGRARRAGRRPPPAPSPGRCAATAAAPAASAAPARRRCRAGSRRTPSAAGRARRSARGRPAARPRGRRRAAGRRRWPGSSAASTRVDLDRDDAPGHARAARGSASPSPGPTSTTTSSGRTPAVRTILRTVFGSMTKFCPSVLVGPQVQPGGQGAHVGGAEQGVTPAMTTRRTCRRRATGAGRTPATGCGRALVELAGAAVCSSRLASIGVAAAADAAPGAQVELVEPAVLAAAADGARVAAGLAPGERGPVRGRRTSGAALVPTATTRSAARGPAPRAAAVRGRGGRRASAYVRSSTPTAAGAHDGLGAAVARGVLAADGARTAMRQPLGLRAPAARRRRGGGGPRASAAAGSGAAAGGRGAGAARADVAARAASAAAAGPRRGGSRSRRRPAPAGATAPTATAATTTAREASGGRARRAATGASGGRRVDRAGACRVTGLRRTASPGTGRARPSAAPSTGPPARRSVWTRSRHRLVCGPTVGGHPGHGERARPARSPLTGR